MAPFRMTYIGGGSRFVVTLLHGLAAQAEALRALNRPIELALLDVNAPRAGEMARYTEIVARQTGLPLTAKATARREEALEGAGWVLFSAGLWNAIMPLRRRFLEPIGDPYGESGPGVAVEAAAVWPFLRSLAADMRRLAPGAVFSALVNPTDVLVAAFEKAFGIPSIGLCVEVPGLIGWLSYYLEVPESDIRVEHLGVNHVGWVSRWRVGGEDGGPLFRERIPARMERDDWYPHPTAFVRLFQTLGYLRASPYHHWPFRTTWTAEMQRQNEAWARACLPAGHDRGTYRQVMLAKALAEGRMIPEPDGTRVHPEATPYTYPNTRHTLGGLVAGLAGASVGPIPLQVRNGLANPALPEDAWVEAPTCLAGGRATPQRVTPLPEWLFAQTAALARQRCCLADWLSGRDPDGLAKGLLAMPEAADVADLLRLARELPAAIRPE